MQFLDVFGELFSALEMKERSIQEASFRRNASKYAFCSCEFLRVSSTG